MLSPKLHKRSIFRGLAPDEARALEPMFRAVCFAPGQVIFAQGDPAATAYVLTAGEVALRLLPEDGGCLTIATIAPEGVFGWSAVLGRRRYTSSAECVAPAAALALRGADLRALLRADQALGRALLAALTRALAGRQSAPPGSGLLARVIQAEIAHAG
jgi:CRP/FNR family transcriptional regulator